MIAVDTNILVYAHRAEMPLHEPALRRLRQLAEGNRPWALPGLAPALEFLEHLLASPSARLLLPGPAYPTLFAEACRDGTARGNLAFDAQIAAVCREHGVTEILTEVRDFTRFSGVTPARLT